METTLRFLRSLTRIAIFLILALAACAQKTPQVTQTKQESPAITPAGKIKLDQSGCTVVSREPTPNPTQQSLIPPVGEKDWVRGPDQAIVTFVEYSDFQ